VAGKKILKTKGSIPDNIKEFFSKDGRINKHAVDRAERYDGLSFLFTDAKLNRQDCLKFYFDKDLVERCFRAEKSVLKLRPINFSTDKNIKSHIMICHLALVLLTTCRERLRKNAIITAPEVALRKLESIYKVYLRGKPSKKKNQDILFNRVNTLSQSQKTILKAIAPKLKCSEEKSRKS